MGHPLRNQTICDRGDGSSQNLDQLDVVVGPQPLTQQSFEHVEIELIHPLGQIAFLPVGPEEQFQLRLRGAGPTHKHHIRGADTTPANPAAHQRKPHHPR